MMVVSSFSQYCCFKKRRRDKREIYDRDTGEETTSKRGPTELWIYKISLKRKKKKKIHRLYEMLAALERASTSSWVYECVPFSSFLSLSLPDLPTRYNNWQEQQQLHKVSCRRTLKSLVFRSFVLNQFRSLLFPFFVFRVLLPIYLFLCFLSFGMFQSWLDFLPLQLLLTFLPLLQ